MTALSVREALRQGERSLVKAGIEDAQGNVRRLIEWVTKKPMWQLLVYDYELTPDEEKDLHKALEDRQSGKPVQYVTGQAPFLDLELSVDESVLIPRFDTESVAAKAIEISRSFRRPLILDIGTGSGAIAIAIAFRNESSRIVATDISPEALRVAESNAETYGVDTRIEFVESDLYKGLRGYRGSFDMIVSNPPYVVLSDLQGLKSEVKDFEPESALSPGEDPLSVYRALASGAGEYLKPEGCIVVEIGNDMASGVRQAVRSTGLFDEIMIFNDVSGTERVLTAKRATGT